MIRNVIDRFARPDGAMGSTEDGIAWQTVSGTWSLAGGRLVKTATNNVQQLAAVETGATDGLVEANIYAGSAYYEGLAARVLDTSNYVMAQIQVNVANGAATQVYKRIANTFFAIAAIPGTPANGDRWGLQAVGSRIKVWRNGALLVNVVDPYPSAGIDASTRWGVMSYTVLTLATHGFEDFAFKPPVLQARVGAAWQPGWAKTWDGAGWVTRSTRRRDDQAAWV